MSKLKHGKDYFSPSQLKKLYLSVGQLNAYLKKTFKSTPAMELGSAVHMRLLEPEKYKETYYTIRQEDIDAKCKEIGGKKPTATTKYKEWLNEIKEQNVGKIAISSYDSYVINKIYDNCHRNGIMDAYFSDGYPELTVKGDVEFEAGDFPALCIIDYDQIDVTIDLKTTSKPLHKFKYDANELGYDIQASLTNRINGKPFIFVVVQTVEPFDVGVFTCSDAFMARGAGKINTALGNYEGYVDSRSQDVIYSEL